MSNHNNLPSWDQRISNAIRMYSSLSDSNDEQQINLIDDYDITRKRILFKGIEAGSGISFSLQKTTLSNDSPQKLVMSVDSSVTDKKLNSLTDVDANNPSSGQTIIWNDNLGIWQNGLPSSQNGGEVNDGNSLGSGFNIFSGKVGATLNFKTLTATGDTTLELDNSNKELKIKTEAPIRSVNGKTGDVVLDASDVGAVTDSHTHDWSEITNKPNLVNSINNKTGDVTLNIPELLNDLKNVSSGNAQDGQVIAWSHSLQKWVPVSVQQIEQGGGGENNSASNLGNGEPVYSGKSGSDLLFKSFTASGDLNISSTGDEINYYINIPVKSVNGKTGDVVLDANDVNAADVNHTHTWSEITNKPQIPNDFVLSVNGNTGNVTLNIPSTLSDLDNVDASNPDDGQTLIWNETFGVWQPGLPSTGGSGSGTNIDIQNAGNGEGIFSFVSGSSYFFKSLIGGSGIELTSDNDEITIDFVKTFDLNDLSDVIINNAEHGDIIVWDSGQNKWVNTEFNLEDLNNSFFDNPSQNDFIYYNGTEWTTINPTFTTLSDTPSNYTGQSNKFIKVNDTENALEFAQFTLGEISDFNINNPQQGEGLVYNGNAWTNDNIVLSVNGRKGNVTLDKSDVNLDNVLNETQLTRSNNLSDLNDISVARSNIGLGQGLHLLTSDEINQLRNIDNVTISNQQWGYLGELNQSLTTTSDTTFNSQVLDNTLTVNGESTLSKTNITDNLTVDGDLTVNGNSFVTETETVQVSDNFIVVNNGETGSGVTDNLAGIEVDRGTLTNYRFVFDETNDTFFVGEIGDLQAVATREVNPINNAVAYWDNVNDMFITSNNMTFDGTTLNVNELTVTNNTTIDNDLTVNGSTLFNDNVDMSNNDINNINNLSANSATLNNQLTVNGTTNIFGNLNMNGNDISNVNELFAQKLIQNGNDVWDKGELTEQQINNFTTAYNKYPVSLDYNNKNIDLNLNDNSTLTTTITLSDYTLNDLGDVENISPNNNDVLIWNTSNSKWEPQSDQNLNVVLSVNGETGNVIIEGNEIDSTVTPVNYNVSNSDIDSHLNGIDNELANKIENIENENIGDLNNVNISNPMSNDFLIYDNGQWTNSSNAQTGTLTNSERFKINYDAEGNIQSVSDVTQGLNVNIIDPSSSYALLDINFTGYNYPPLSIIVYGEDVSQNAYRFDHLDHRAIRNKLTNNNSGAFGDVSTETLRIVAKESLMNVLRTGSQSSGATIDWTYNDGNTIHDVLFNENTNYLYVVNDNSELLRLDTNANVIWRENINNKGLEIVKDDDDNLYITNDNGNIIKFDPINRNNIFTYTRGVVMKSIAYYNGFIYFADENGVVGKLDANNNSLIWETKPVDDKRFRSVDVDSLGNVYATGDEQLLVKISKDGNIKWYSDILRKNGYSVTVDNQDNIIVGDDDGYLSKLDQDGNTIWISQVLKQGTNTFDRTRIRSMETDSFGNVFVGTYDSNIHKFNINGDINWIVNDHSNKVITLYYDSNNSKLYTGSQDSNVKKIDISTPTVNPHAWVQFILPK